MELFEDAAYVALNGLFAKEELVGDGGVFHTGGDAFEDFYFAAAELGEELAVVKSGLG